MFNFPYGDHPKKFRVIEATTRAHLQKKLEPSFENGLSRSTKRVRNQGPRLKSYDSGPPSHQARKASNERLSPGSLSDVKKHDEIGGYRTCLLDEVRAGGGKSMREEDRHHMDEASYRNASFTMAQPGQ